MATKKAAVAPVVISSMEEAQEALQEMLDIGDEIKDQMARQVDLKKAVTAWAVKKKVEVIQLEDRYFRQINRSTRFWVLTDADMPDPTPRGAKSLRDICTGLTAVVKGKQIPLFNYITKRVVDPEKIDKAIALGFVKEGVISKAFLEKPQTPFLQSYSGEAD